MRPRFFNTSPLIRLVCFILCYSLVSPLPAFTTRPGAAINRAAAAAKPSTKTNTARTTNQTTQKASWREGELLVRFREHAPAAKMNALLRSNGARWNGQLRGASGVERLRLAEGSNPEAVASALRSSDLVEFAEPNYLITADQTASQAVPDDPRFSEQWALKNTGAAQAWSKTTGSKQTVIAVIDSGIDFTHPDLINNQWDNTLERPDGKDEDGNSFNDDLHGWDFVTNSQGIIDAQGHGTAVAGIIAAQGNNSIGISGVMWQVSLMSLRVLDKTGTGDIASAVEAIDYATMNGAQVINCSWGTDYNSPALLEAISRANKHGVVVVTSVGNNNREIETTAHYPASYELPNLISVASTDESDQLTSFSNWGARHVSIAAPGTEILTTKIGGDYQTISGSSASAPFVTGIAGLIKTLRPWLGADRTREIILRGARTVPSLTDKVASKGIINAAGALKALDALPPQEGLDEGNGNNGGEHGAAPDSGENNRGGRTSNRTTTLNPDRNRNGDEFKVTPPARTQGVPSSGLPNLDELKRKKSINPKAIDPVPSTRCSHKDPDCASERRKASLESPTGLLAWSGDTSSFESPVIHSSRAISDSPFSIFWSSPSLSLAPSPAPQTVRTNVALATNGGVATASSSLTTGYAPDGAINGDRKGLNWANGGGWTDGTVNTFPDWIQVEFGGPKSIDEIDVFGVQDNYSSPLEPTQSMAWTLYGLPDFQVQYWNGTTWLDVAGGNVTGNNLVWRKFTFLPITTTKIRVVGNNALYGHSRVTELEAYGVDASLRTNVALASNGATATASSYLTAGYAPSGAINGERKGLNWANGGGWTDGTVNSFPDWLQVDFNGNKTIDEIDVFGVQDNYANPLEPTTTMTWTLYGLPDFQVQYWNGSSWVDVPSGNVMGNNRIWRKFTFSPITTSKIRVVGNNALYGHSRLTEVEAYGTGAVSSVINYSTELTCSRATPIGVCLSWG
jgi:subtilisin family serine protease